MARLAVAVQPEQRAERAVLEPADHQLAVLRVERVAAVEAADVGGPPRDAADRDVQPGTDLRAQAREGGGDVTGPQGRAVPLAARPRGARPG